MIYQENFTGWTQRKCESGISCIKTTTFPPNRSTRLFALPCKSQVNILYIDVYKKLPRTRFMPISDLWKSVCRVSKHLDLSSSEHTKSCVATDPLHYNIGPMCERTILRIEYSSSSCSCICTRPFVVSFFHSWICKRV